MKIIAAAALMALAGAVTAQAQQAVTADAQARTGLSLTLYEGGFALVRDERRVALPQGEVALALAGVAARIEPDTAMLQADRLTVLEQMFDFDLLTPDALIEAAVGSTVRIYRAHPSTGEERVETARVLSANEGVVLEIDGRIEILDKMPGRIVFDSIPQGLQALPTLSILVDASQAGERTLSLTYLTEGLSWEADYVGVLAGDEERLELKGWATLTNDSGTDFPEAAVQLVAGDVRRLGEQQPQRRHDRREMALASAEAAQEPLQDYHLYTLPRSVTLTVRQTRQVGFLGAPRVAVEKSYRYEPFGFATEETPDQVSVRLAIPNTEKAGLGQPLPGGILRVYTADSKGRLQFVGEDRLRHTPAGETAQAYLGEAFDVTVLPRQISRDYVVNTEERRVYEATQEYVLANAKEKAVTVEIAQRMPGRDWTILKASQDPERTTAERAIWQVKVPAEGTATLQFTARVEE